MRDIIVDLGAMILDVVDLEAERAQSNQMVEQLPDDARERVSHREMENNNPALAFHLDPAAATAMLDRWWRTRVASLVLVAGESTATP